MAGNDGILIVHSMLEIAEVCRSDVVIADRHHLMSMVWNAGSEQCHVIVETLWICATRHAWR